MEFTKFEDTFNADQIEKLNEVFEYELTETESKLIEVFEAQYNEGAITDQQILDWLENPVNEGVLGSIFGGLTGFALGKKLGGIVAKILGVEKGILYDLLTSRIFGAALGSSIGKQF